MVFYSLTKFPKFAANKCKVVVACYYVIVIFSVNLFSNSEGLFMAFFCFNVLSIVRVNKSQVAETSHSGTRRKSLGYSDPETLWTKIKDLKALLVEPQERALRFERGQRKRSCIRGQIVPTRISKTTGNQ